MFVLYWLKPRKWYLGRWREYYCYTYGSVGTKSGFRLLFPPPILRTKIRHCRLMLIYLMPELHLQVGHIRSKIWSHNPSAFAVEAWAEWCIYRDSTPLCYCIASTWWATKSIVGPCPQRKSNWKKENEFSERPLPFTGTKIPLLVGPTQHAFESDMPGRRSQAFRARAFLRYGNRGQESMLNPGVGFGGLS